MVTYYFINLTANIGSISSGLNKEDEDQPDVSPVRSKLCFSTNVSSGNSRLNAIKLHDEGYKHKIKHQQGARDRTDRRIGWRMLKWL